jgi:hypothetical protein
MVLFINGFEKEDWEEHEVNFRKPGCKNALGYIGGNYVPFGLTTQLCVAVGGGFQENKTGNVYSPARDITSGSPYYKGKRMGYWDSVKKIISDGFKDDKLFFINGSSDNRTTGQYRFAIGEKLGNEILRNWEWLADFPKKFSDIGEKKYETNRLKNLPTNIRASISNSLNYTADQLINEIGKHNPAFTLTPNETLKIVGHSMGAAISAGLASAISKHPIFCKRLEVVFYLAPHQPQHFVHPANVKGYQSSSKEDLVTSKNDVGKLTLSTGNPIGIAIYNSFNPQKQIPYTTSVPLSISWAKGLTAYQLIKNINPTNFIQNKTHTLGSMRGHSVDTYIDEIQQFFKIYSSTSAHRN